MSSSSPKVGAKKEHKVWEDAPVTFTEFGALASEEKPRGGFFSRLWKRGNNDEDRTTPNRSVSVSPEESTDRMPPSSDVESIISAALEAPTSDSVLTSRGSKSSLTDTDSTLGENLEGTDDQRTGNAFPHRTLSSVLHRLSSILDQRSTTPQTYKDSDFKQYWMPDHSCRECYDCGDKFTTFRRRHHCRICGQIFCSKCCNQELPGKIIGYKGGIRVCIYCCKVVQRYAQHTVTTGDVRALEDLRAMSQMSESGSFDFGSRSLSPHPVVGGDELSPPVRGESMPELPGLKTPEMSMPFDLTPQSEFPTEETLLHESKVLIKDSVELRELWRQICDPDLGVETQTLRIRLRTYTNCIVGKELVNWLIDKDKAAKRVQAMGIGQALLYAGYLECVGNQPPIFKDDFTLYRPGENAVNLDLQGDVEPVPTITEELEKNEPLWLQEIEKEEEDDDSVTDDHSITITESGAHKSISSETDARTLYYLSETSHSGSFSEIPKFQLLSRDLVEEPLPRQDSSVQGLADEFLKGALYLGKSCMPSSDVVTCPQGWRQVDQLREENGEKLAYGRLRKAHSEHWHTLTRQLLSQNGLLPSWEPVISASISQITHYVRPDVRLEADDMDIRSYIHIKKIPGGQKSDTNLVHGVIFTKNIAHKKMKAKIANPLILLLRGTIEFQRVEQKFSSLEPQILQEREFMRNCIMKMIAYRPNVVVVEKSVSRLAQEFLLQAGITLLYNVKLSVMERLARFTQADIVPSIDGLVGKPNMGFCHDFRCQTYTLPNKETKTLAVFDGCATHLGCTVVLTGGSVSELRRVKAILKFMSYTAYNSLLELCYCMDEFALPQPGGDELHRSFEAIDSSDQLADDLANRTLTAEDQSCLESKAKSKSPPNKESNCKKSNCHLQAKVIEREDSASDGHILLRSVSAWEKVETNDCEDENEEDDKEQSLVSVGAGVKEIPPNKDPSPANSPPLNNGGNNPVSDGIKTPSALTATPTPSLMSSLTVESEKKRHSSGLSVSSENTSGRSSPAHPYLMHGGMGVDNNSVYRDFLSNETNHLVGNIFCIIPPCDDSYLPPAPKRESAGGISSDDTTQGNSTAAATNVVGSSNNDVVDAVFTKDSSSTVTALDGNPFSQKVALTKEQEEEEMGQGQGQESKRMRAIHSTSSSNSSYGRFPSNTSQLTELTDFSDPLLGYQNTQDESIFDPARGGSSTKIALKEIKQTKYKRFRRALDGVHLSVSPYHKSSVPFIETDKGLSCGSRRYLLEEIFWSPLFDGEAGSDPKSGGSNKLKTVQSEGGGGTVGVMAGKQQPGKGTIEILSHHPFITCNLTEPIWEKSTQSILADFRARGGRIQVTDRCFNSKPLISMGETNGNAKKEDASSGNGINNHVLWEKKVDCLDPANHQRLMVLFSSFSFKSSNHPYPCVYPWVVTMEFYGRNDITLGGFLERFCFRKQYSCPSPSCDVPMTDHIRRFIHGNACINVLLRKLDNEWPGGKENILMWSWCRKCKQVTPVVPISADTWSLSFAKYLDLRFHSSSLQRRGSADPCPHSLHHEHFQYFCHRDVVASFKYSTISLKELVLPAPQVTLKPATFNSAQLSQKVSKITSRATERYSLIFENTMKLKHEMTSEVQTKTLSDFLTEQQSDKTQFRNAATNIQMKIQDLTRRVREAVHSGHPKDHSGSDVDLSHRLHAIEDNIKLLKRIICEDVVKWNTKIQEFVTSQQKKMRTLHRKDKEAASTDELEKSLKISAAPSSKTSASTHSTPVAVSSTPASSLGDGAAESSLPSADKSLAVEGDPSSGQSESSSSQTAASQEEGVNGQAGEAPVNASAAACQPDSVANTNAVTGSANSTTTNAPPSNTTALPVVAEVTVTGTDDTPDGWLQDLKGVTRRWLSPIAFSPLSLPFNPSEHYTLPLCERLPVIVYDQAPSSIIAYALSSSDYLQRLKEIQTASRSGSPEIGGQSTQAAHIHSLSYSRVDSGGSSSNHGDGVYDAGRKTGVLSFLRGSLNSSREGNSPSHQNHHHHHKNNHHHHNHHHKHSSSSKPALDSVHYVPKSDLEESIGALDESDEGKPLEDSTPSSPDEKSKPAGSASSPHIELQFSDTSARFYCRIYFAEQFRKLRKLILPGGESIFIRALCHCKPWEAKGGKSGSAFSKTEDDRFILKQMSTMEVESFEKFGPQYFSYIRKCVSENHPTALAKILGVFRIGFRNATTNNALRQDVLVMENLFYNRKISQKFDLKGSLRNRLVSTAGRRGEEELVLLDENLLKSSVENPLYLRPHSKAVLKSAITSDSAFLSANLVMDYSLLVGIDENTGQMVVGIIDYIRTFTWDKKLEMVVKSSGILGGQGKMPTVVSPQLYRSRFLEAMDHYFLQVPTSWTGLGMDSYVPHP